MSHSSPTLTLTELAATPPWATLDPATLATSLEGVPATDRYELLGEIARGGMGIVYRCRDRQLQRDLALKVLPHGSGPHHVRRFLEEAQVAGRLQHPGVVPVHELGKLPDGRLFFTMKLVVGRTLAAELAARPSPADRLPHFLGIFQAICQTLAYAHSEGVIHRDLKPLNVMVGAFGEVQVMDWGLAKSSPHTPCEESSSPPARPDATQAGTILGTPAYLPPEQARGVKVDARADVFGLGAILCEILTGQPPYAGSDTRDLAFAADLRPALERLAACSAEADLLALCRRCLAVDPAARPADAGHVAAAVAAYLAGVAERLRRAEIAAGKRRLRFALVGTVFAALLLAGGLWLWQREQARARSEESSDAVNQVLGKIASLGERVPAHPATLADWRTAEALRGEALAAAEQAAQTTADVNPTTRAALEALLPELRAAAAATARNRALLERLQQAAFLANDALNDDDFDHYLSHEANSDAFLYSSRTGRAAYAAAFATLDLDVLSAPADEVLARLAAAPLRPALTLALEDWLRLTESPAHADRLRDLLTALDPEPFRTRVRRAVEQRDRGAMRRLAGEDAAPALPLPTLLRLADGLFGGDELEPAIALLRRAQVAQPGEFWLHNKLGEFLMYTAGSTPVRVEEATRFFTAALVVRPESEVARINLGDALVFLGAYEESLATYRKARSARPNLVFLQTKYATALAIAGYHEEAWAASERAVRQRPHSAWVQEAHASVCTLLGRHADAVTACRAALALQPEVAPYQATLGKALAELGNYPEAIAALRAAVRLRPRAAYWAALADVLFRARDVEAARVAARAAIAAQPNAAVGHLALANVHNQAGRPDLAISTLREAALLAPHDSGVWWQLAVLLRKQNHTDEAVVAQREALRRGPLQGSRRVAQLTDLARMLDRGGAAELLVTLCRDTLTRTPRDAAVWTLLGQARQHLGDLQGAEDALRQALALAPAGANARQRLLDLLVAQSRIDEAEQLCEQAPDAVRREFHARRVRLLLACGRATEALDLVRVLPANQPGFDALAWHLRGQALAQLDRVEEAVGAYSRVIQAAASPEFAYPAVSIEYGDLLLRRDRPGDPALGHSYQGWGLLHSGRPDAAVAAYQRAVEAEPKKAGHHLGLGDALLAAHEVEAARAAYETALRLERSDRAQLGLAKALRELGQYRPALQALRALRPGLDLAALLRETGDFEAARAAYARLGRPALAAECAVLADLMEHLPAFVAGEAEALPEHRLALAECAARAGEPALASRLFEAARQAGELAPEQPLWELALQAAARAGSAPQLSEEVQARHRDTARARLRAAVERVNHLLAAGADPNEQVGTLARWERAPALAGVRGAALQKLDPKERRLWQHLWDGIATLRKLAELKRAGDTL